MRVLFDQGTPAPLRKFLLGHEVTTASELGWSELANGELLRAAEEKFDALVTTDQRIRYQQNLAGRRLAILALPFTSWPKMRPLATQVAAAVDRLGPGDYVELKFA